MTRITETPCMQFYRNVKYAFTGLISRYLHLNLNGVNVFIFFRFISHNELKNVWEVNDYLKIQLIRCAYLSCDRINLFIILFYFLQILCIAAEKGPQMWNGSCTSKIEMRYTVDDDYTLHSNTIFCRDVIQFRIQITKKRARNAFPAKNTLFLSFQTTIPYRKTNWAIHTSNVYLNTLKAMWRLCFILCMDKKWFCLEKNYFKIYFFCIKTQYTWSKVISFEVGVSVCSYINFFYCE